MLYYTKLLVNSFQTTLYNQFKIICFFKQVYFKIIWALPAKKRVRLLFQSFCKEQAKRIYTAILNAHLKTNDKKIPPPIINAKWSLFFNTSILKSFGRYPPKSGSGFCFNLFAKNRQKGFITLPHIK
jgi:hypothetical protein